MSTQVLLGMLLGAGPLGAAVTLIKWRKEGKVPEAQAAKTSAETEAIIEEKLWERTSVMLDRMEKENQRDREKFERDLASLRAELDSLREQLVQERALHQADAFALNEQRARVTELEGKVAAQEHRLQTAKSERDTWKAKYDARFPEDRS